MQWRSAPSVAELGIHVPDAAKTIHDTITELLSRRGVTGVEITSDSRLSRDLELDSLELAELSAALEDDLGHDPYSEGLVPETVGELVGYYHG
jgi:acyl carrier protein